MMERKRKQFSIHSFFSKRPAASNEVKEHEEPEIEEREGSEDGRETHSNCQEGQDSLITNVQEVHAQPENSFNDIGLLIEKKHSFSDSERYHFLTSDVQVPILPTKRQDQRRFKESWLKDERFASWLIYTQSTGGGGLCKVCALMNVNSKAGNLGKFVVTPCVDFKKFVFLAQNHRELERHVEAVRDSKVFIEKYTSGKNIKTAISSSYAAARENNRLILTSIIKTVVLCAEANIALRGKTNTGGNFNRLLHFRVDAGDKVLEHHLQHMAGNAKYLSPSIQNEILSTVSSIIIEQIVAEANNSFLAVIADETTDISGKKQLSVVIRYLKDFSVQERFTGFLELDACSASAITTKILDHLSQVGINKDQLVGQGYDGASTMAGHVSGVQKRIRDIYPRAIYIHCASHLLNLSVNDQNHVREIRRTVDVIRKTIRYFRENSTRKEPLNGLNLPLFSPTRWNQKYKSIRVFRANFTKLFEALENSSDDQAFPLIAVLEKHTIVYCMCLIARISGYIEPLAVMLQERGLCIIKAKKMVMNLKDLLEEERNSDGFVDEIYKETCDLVGVKELSRPRIVTNQVHRSNTPSSSSFEYYKLSLFLPYMDSLIQSLNDRFIENDEFFALFSILPPNEPQNLVNVENLYGLDNLSSEVKLWRRELSQSHDGSISILSMLQSTFKVYPSVHKALEVILALPATSVEAERSFSCMRIIKTWLRSTMTTDRLSDLCTIHSNTDRITEDLVAEVVRRMCSHNRRLMF